jgi:DNA-cytosine methyltransferase
LKIGNVLSCFDGMSCGQIALERAGIEFDTYYASEIDKYAAKVALYNYPNTIQLGDITKWKEWYLPNIELLIGGSPCQGFSFAGKQLNFEDARSKLFFEFVDILKHYKPKYFLLENVRMKQEHQDVISQYLGVKPIIINSALVSAQNRIRLYWTNIPNITQPIDRGILLKDILLEDATEPMLSNIYGGFKETVPREHYNKSVTLRTPAGGGHIPSVTVKKYVPENVEGNYVDPYNKKEIEGEKSTTLRTNSSNGNMWVRMKQVPHGANLGGVTERLKSPSITMASWENNNFVEASNSIMPIVQSNTLWINGIVITNFQGNATLSIEVSKFRTLLAQAGGVTKDIGIHKKATVGNESSWRKLTPIECERLQTVPDNYTSCVSNSQRYKMLGNGWTVDVVAHIFKNIGQVNRFGTEVDLFSTIKPIRGRKKEDYEKYTDGRY